MILLFQPTRVGTQTTQKGKHMPRRYLKEEPTHDLKHTKHHHYAALLTGIALIAISIYNLTGN